MRKLNTYLRNKYWSTSNTCCTQKSKATVYAFFFFLPSVLQVKLNEKEFLERHHLDHIAFLSNSDNLPKAFFFLWINRDGEENQINQIMLSTASVANLASQSITKKKENTKKKQNNFCSIAEL